MLAVGCHIHKHFYNVLDTKSHLVIFRYSLFWYSKLVPGMLRWGRVVSGPTIQHIKVSVTLRDSCAIIYTFYYLWKSIGLCSPGRVGVTQLNNTQRSRFTSYQACPFFLLNHLFFFFFFGNQTNFVFPFPSTPQRTKTTFIEHSRTQQVTFLQQSRNQNCYLGCKLPLRLCLNAFWVKSNITSLD